MIIVVAEAGYISDLEVSCRKEDWGTFTISRNG